MAEDNLAKELERGEHNPSDVLGFDSLPAPAAQVVALRDAIASPTARAGLYTLIRISRGDLAAKKLCRGLTEANWFGDDKITATITEVADLHDHM